MRGAECEALDAGPGSSGQSLIDGSGAPPAVTGSRAGASSVTGLRAGAFVVTPVGAVFGSVGRSGRRSLGRSVGCSVGR